MPVRKTILPIVPKEEFGIQVLVRYRPDKPDGDLELVATVPSPDGKGGMKMRRRRRTARTKDPVLAHQRARALAQKLASTIKGVPKKLIRAKFASGQDITDMDCIAYYESEVLPSLRKNDNEYGRFAASKIRVLRKLLPLVAKNHQSTPLRLIDQAYVDDYTALRLEKGALRRDGSGEWREVEDLDEDDRKLKLGTVETDLLLLRRAIDAAKSYQVKDAQGRWLSVIQYDPFLDQTKRIQFPQETDITRQPILDYESFEQLVSAADAWDRQCNAEYERLRYRERFPNFAPRCPGYSEAILKVARQGRRREDLTRLRWLHVVFAEDSVRMAEVIDKVLGIKVSPEQARAIFPAGLIVWSRGKTDVFRFAPMPRYLADVLRRFKSGHPHKDNPKGPIFYGIQDSRKALSVGNLADWFPRLQKHAGIQHSEEEGWHMFRRLFRQERLGHFSNKIVAYCGGWSRLTAIDKILDVDESQAMNRHYLQVLLRQMYACMSFDGSKIDSRNHISGVSEHVLAQLREEGYLDSSGAESLRTSVD